MGKGRCEMKTNIVVMAIVVLTVMAVAVLPVGAQSAGPDFQVTLNPPDGQSVGNSINIHIKVNSANPGATRIFVSCGGVSKGETSEVEFDSNWNTNGCSGGNQQITIQARNPDDPNWSNPNTKTFNYNLTGSSQPPTPPKGPNISIFEFSPGSAIVGDSVNIHIRVDSSNPGATKLNVSCGSISKNETSEVEFNSTWNTTGCPAGTATVTVLSRDVNDPNWANPSSASRSYNLNAAPVPVPSPTANFWADSTNVLQGQCTYLHWDTGNAVSVDIDGSTVSASGTTQVCPSVTQKFTLSAHASSGGVDANRNVTITVTAVQQPPAVINSFQTGNVIDIGGNIYVIVGGQRRHVPNPATLDALGISQSGGLINNKGFNDSQLSQIVQGPDIPDVNIDPTGFGSFKATYFPNLAPIVPKPPTQVPTAVPQVVQPTAQPVTQPTEAPLQPAATPVQKQSEQGNPTGTPPESETFTEWWCHQVGLFCDNTVDAAPIVNIDCQPQCVATARKLRPDLNDWALGAGTPNNILAIAQMGKLYGQTQQMRVKVRGSGEQPQEHDLVVWLNGHIGFVEKADGMTMYVTDSNWGTPLGVTKCYTRSWVPITFDYSKMRLITSPYSVNITVNNPTDKCNGLTGWNRIVCKWNSIWGH